MDKGSIDTKGMEKWFTEIIEKVKHFGFDEFIICGSHMKHHLGGLSAHYVTNGIDSPIRKMRGVLMEWELDHEIDTEHDWLNIGEGKNK